MATYLYRLGKTAFVRRKLLLVAWVAMLVVAGIGAATLSGPTATSFSIPGTEAQDAIDRLQEKFPALSASGATARVVFAAPDAESLADPASAEAVAAVLAELGTADKVAFVTNPLTAGTVSPDQATAFAEVTYTVPSIDLQDSDREALSSAADIGREAGLTVEFGGDALQEYPEQGASELIGLRLPALLAGEDGLGRSQPGYRDAKR
jgi:putative drug exporter of the RND superfamily